MPDNNNNEMTTRTRTRHMQIHRHAKLVHVQHLAGKRCKVVPYLALVSLTLAAYTIANLGAGKNLTASSTGLIPVASASPGPEPSAAGGRTHRLPPINGSIFGKRSVQSLGQIHKQQTTTTTKSRSKATSYQDIITKIIEDFLALNNESKCRLFEGLAKTMILAELLQIRICAGSVKK